MAKPTAPSVGTRILYYGSVPPARTSFIQQPSGDRIYNPLPAPNAPLDVGGGAGVPGLVVSVSGATPDYLNSIFVVYGADGSVNIRTGVPNISTWVTAGSDPTKNRWDYVDLTA